MILVGVKDDFRAYFVPHEQKYYVYRGETVMATGFRYVEIESWTGPKIQRYDYKYPHGMVPQITGDWMKNSKGKYVKVDNPSEEFKSFTEEAEERRAKEKKSKNLLDYIKNLLPL